MNSHRSLPSLWLAPLLLFHLPVAVAASQSHTSLVVDIRPMARVEAPSSLLWEDAGNTPSVQLPLSVTLRLSRGTHADLSISREKQSGTFGNGADGGLPPRLQVEGSGGVSELSETPVLVRQYFQSGFYRHAVVVRIASAPSNAQEMVVLRLRLSSNDGSVEWSAPVQIRLQTPVRPPAAPVLLYPR